MDSSTVEGGNMHIAKQNIITEAEQMAEELSGQDSGYVRSVLSDVAQEDFVLYAVVAKKLEELRGIQRREAEAAVQQQ